MTKTQLNSVMILSVHKSTLINWTELTLVMNLLQNHTTGKTGFFYSHTHNVN